MMIQILTHLDNIKKIVTKYNLSHIIIETGEDNIFIKGENKFIVTKDFLANFPFLFFLATELKSVDFTKFDFSEITTMAYWFNGAFNLKKIIFPAVVKCDKLNSLQGCFSYTGLRELDLSDWSFKSPIDLSLLVSSCLKIKKLTLPETSVYACKHLASRCSCLKEVDFNGIFYNERELKIKNNSWFLGCVSLKKINCKKMKVPKGLLNIAFARTSNNLKNVPMDCKILLP